MSSGSSGLSHGAVAGIVIGSVIGALLLCFLLAFLVWCTANPRGSKEEASMSKRAHSSEASKVDTQNTYAPRDEVELQQPHVEP